MQGRDLLLSKIGLAVMIVGLLGGFAWTFCADRTGFAFAHPGGFPTLGARPVMSADHHPRKHPLATTKQNTIAVMWRRFHK